MGTGSIPASGKPSRRAKCVVTGSLAGLILVTAHLEAARTCTITVSPLAFGNYPPATPAPVDSTALIQVGCSGDPDPGQPGFYTLRIDGGTSGDPGCRQSFRVTVCILRPGGQVSAPIYGL